MQIPKNLKIKQNSKYCLKQYKREIWFFFLTVFEKQEKKKYYFKENLIVNIQNKFFYLQKLIEKVNYCKKRRKMNHYEKFNSFQQKKIIYIIKQKKVKRKRCPAQLKISLPEFKLLKNIYVGVSLDYRLRLV
eukprot:TRINITY_DN4322_c0_g1_i1.p1 TRINITY_DN4322_c0_g1~~TRINITY_DN4322_c0_g1_i1.p1  ORF type:complete len:132 (-),score=25.76 TRINITY_DN4322_c0_g1_i1:175-570(-)